MNLYVYGSPSFVHVTVGAIYSLLKISVAAFLMVLENLKLVK